MRKVVLWSLAIATLLPLAVAVEARHRFYSKHLPASVPFELFGEALPIPPVLKIPKGQTDIEIRLTQFEAKLHKDFDSPATLWGYNGSFPGPTIEVEKDQFVRIHWKNELPATHFLPSPAGAMTTGITPSDRFRMDGPHEASDQEESPGFATSLGAGNLPDVRNVTHLHGAFVSDLNPMNRLHNNDGWPDAWNVPGQEQIAEYTNHQSARMLWYHDHAFGTTGRNVTAGLAGAYIIRDEEEAKLNLPSGEFEIPLILQAVGVRDDGTTYYTDVVSTEFFGNAIAVNGKILPYLEVEPRKYRFRILNASASRAYGLSLVDIDDFMVRGPAFHQIGTDAGLMAAPALLNDPQDPNALPLFLGASERADVVIDFATYEGRTFLLVNEGAVTDPDVEMRIPRVMQVRVKTTLSAPDLSDLPAKLVSVPRLDEASASQKRTIVMTQTDFPDGSSLFQLSGRSWNYIKSDQEGRYWDYEINEKPAVGTTELWELVNTTVLTHPFHAHLAQFQILDRTPIDGDQFKETGTLTPTGPVTPPDVNEVGWKDVVRVPPHQVTRILVQFAPTPGYSMYHCHMLEHEDMDMMVPFQVVGPDVGPDAGAHEQFSRKQPRGRSEGNSRR